MVSSTVELHEQYGDRLAVIGMDVQEDPDVVRSFVDEQGMRYLHLISDADTLQNYGVRGHPMTVLITPGGQVFRVYSGYTEKAALEQGVRALLELE